MRLRRRHIRVVPAERVDDPVGDVTFPDPTHYDVIVPLGARWPVYDEALRQTWVGAEMQMLRDAADAGVPTLGVCFGGQLLAQAFGGSVARSTKPEIGWYDVASDDEPDTRRPVVPMAFRRVDTAAGRHRDRQERERVAGVRARPGARPAIPPRARSRLLERWLADDRNDEVASVGLTHDELRSATKELERSAARAHPRSCRGFLSRVACQPCPS